MQAVYPSGMKERALFFALVALQLVPFWMVDRVPTTDGPSHVYNAWIQLHLHDARHPLLARFFEIDPRPLPNWTAQAALVSLLAVLPPATPETAEKVLVSAYVVLLLWAARFFVISVDPERSWLSFLAFPFAVHWGFHIGFYSFSLGVAFWLLTLGVWWRGRSRPGPGLALAVNALLLLCWFSHIVAHVLALVSLGVLWLATLPGAVRSGGWRRHLLHLLLLAPQVALPLWFVTAQQGNQVFPSAQPLQALEHFAAMRMLFIFGSWWLRLTLAAVFAALTLLTLWQRRRDRGFQETDAFLVLAAVLTVVFLLSPGGMAGGSMLQPRLMLFPFLALLPWLAPAPLPTARRAVIAVMVVLSLWNTVNLARAYRVLAQDFRGVVAAAGPIAPGSRVLSLMFNDTASLTGPVWLSHAFDRVSVQKGLVDWSDYEPVSGVFPNRFKPSAPPHPTLWQIQREPATIDIESYKAWTDYVYTYRMPAGSPLEQRLARSYDLVRQVGEARLYERRDRLRPPGIRE
jgi:hypothetical protein